MNAPRFPFLQQATAIGSVPHTDPQQAVDLVLKELPEAPAWPQLPNRSPLEHMAPQFAEGITDATVEGDVVVLPGMPGEHDMPELSAERAPGFFALLEADLSGIVGLKGQVTGPMTFSRLVQLEGGPAEEDLRVCRRLAHLLGRLAEWQEAMMRRKTRNTLILVDEPFLADSLANKRLGSAIAMDFIASTLMWVHGPRGLHTCAAPNWRFLFNLPLNVLSFDAYTYGESVTEAAKGIRTFLGGGVIAWGIVPATQAELDKEDADSLMGRLEGIWDKLAAQDVPRAVLERQSMFTPACGLAGLTPEGAGKALRLTREIAARVRGSVNS